MQTGMVLICTLADYIEPNQYIMNQRKRKKENDTIRHTTSRGN